MSDQESGALAIVTGTSSGIGAALATELLARGWTVLGMARRPVERVHSNYRHLCLDLSDVEACQEILSGAFRAEYLSQQSWLKIALINNAACLGPTGPVTQLDLAELQKALTLNVAFPAWFMGFLVEQTRETKPSIRIVNISSGAASSAYPGWGAYCMSKSALRMAGQVLAIEAEEVASVMGRDIRIVDYAPGVVDTPMQIQARSADPASFPRVQKFIDLHKNGDLVAADRPAREIAELLDRDDLAAFSIKRFGA
jgi:benzil reductase ((S)-benzoin forming)